HASRLRLHRQVEEMRMRDQAHLAELERTRTHAMAQDRLSALGTLVAVEVALSLVLLTGAGLLISSFVRLQNIDPGFRADGVLTARVSLPGVRYDGEQGAAFYERLIERVSALPGVESAAGVSFLPLAGPGMATSFYRLDRPVPGDGEAPTTQVRPVTPGFFETMRIPFVAGRDFTAGDREDAPLVAIISETLARQHLGTADAVGHRLHVNIGRPGGMDVEVVGVVSDIAIASLDADPGFAVYLPQPQLSINLLTLVVRTAVEPASLTPSVAATLGELDPLLPLADVRTMEEVVGRTLSRQQVVAVLLAAFSALALVLASLGVYGVMAYSVAQRTQEFGVRMALGATPRSVVSMVLGQGLRPVLAGVAVGLAAAAGLTRFLDSLLYETPALDPWTFAGTAVLLTLVSLLASWVPARRGTRVAPVQALRSE
ncbi:MAG: FtsX-like permease family protein, partial [Vicinamibacteria bacterium]